MAARTTSRHINAPVDIVFSAITDIEKFPEKNPDIVKVEMLTEQKVGVGSRFRETRKMKDREASTELECTEYVENERVRFVADQGGTIWDSVFVTTPAGGGTDLSLVMEARPHRFLAKIVTPLIMGMVGKAVEGDMDAVKKYCERVAANGAPV